MGKSQQAQGPDGFGFIVHNYVCTSTSSALPSAGVIDAGRVFIKQASISTGWSPSKLAPDTSVFSAYLFPSYYLRLGEAHRLEATCNVLSFSQVPPVVAGQMTRQRIHELKEWGTSANGDDDSFSLNDLEEFKSTDFQWAPPGAMDPRIGSDAVSVPILTLARKYSSTKMTEGPKPKRRRLDISPLHSIIPKVCSFPQALTTVIPC
jgi:hypothetical protein